jgi:hypothetical protein
MMMENNTMQPNTSDINNTMNNQNRALTNVTYRELQDYARGIQAIQANRAHLILFE